MVMYVNYVVEMCGQRVPRSPPNIPATPEAVLRAANAMGADSPLVQLRRVGEYRERYGVAERLRTPTSVQPC